MLAMGRVLMIQPAVFLLDEPTANLAPQVAAELLTTPLMVMLVGSLPARRRSWDFVSTRRVRGGCTALRVTGSRPG